MLITFSNVSSDNLCMVTDAWDITYIQAYHLVSLVSSDNVYRSPRMCNLLFKHGESPCRHASEGRTKITVLVSYSVYQPTEMAIDWSFADVFHKVRCRTSSHRHSNQVHHQ